MMSTNLTTTIRQFGLIRKRQDISIEQFHYHWREIHGPLGLSALPSVRRYIQNHRFFKEQLPDFLPASYDGASEVFLNSLEDAIELGKSRGYLEIVRPDEAKWLDANADHLIAYGYEVFANEPIPQNAFLIKALLFLKRKPGMSVAEFQEHWLQTNAPLANQIPGLLRYEQCHVALETYNEHEPTFDGVAELWWSDLTTMKRSWSSVEMQGGLLRDLRSILDEQASTGMLVYEVRMLWA